ncbi:MAG TPA: sulfatase [Prosthecobacter sp.]|nr:sulfatase [Prosthecobacter sp.]
MRPLLLIASLWGVLSSVSAAEKPNLLIITVDDMSADSVGAFGGKLAGATPSIDKLAASGMAFHRAHVVVGNCMPSRNVMWSGLFPHNNGVEGLYQVPAARHPVLPSLLRDAGWFTAIRHKVDHSTPYSPHPGWDATLETTPEGQRADTKQPKSYRVSLQQGVAKAKAAGKPFCLMLNVADPHKPFHAEGKKGETVPDKNSPTRVFAPDEIPVPGFLFNDPVPRKELAHYYSSVRRADDGVGEILSALKESGQEANTIIVFLSDHGMPLPFAKTQLYHHSTRTPLIVVWPGVTKAGTVDDAHMISTVDLMPTLLEMLDLEPPKKLDGRSFTPLLMGERLADREYVFKEHNENAGASRDPMRGVQSKQWLYLFNPWSNGSRVMATATTGTPTYRRMAQLAQTDPVIAARHRLYQHRVLEELYDVEADPDCLKNLTAAPEHQKALNEMRAVLEEHLERSKDPVLNIFRNRDDAAAREAYVRGKEQESDSRGPCKKGAGKRKKAAAKAAEE